MFRSKGAARKCGGYLSAPRTYGPLHHSEFLLKSCCTTADWANGNMPLNTPALGLALQHTPKNE
jgi:hypothetical protein